MRRGWMGLSAAFAVGFAATSPPPSVHPLLIDVIEDSGTCGPLIEWHDGVLDGLVDVDGALALAADVHASLAEQTAWVVRAAHEPISELDWVLAVDQVHALSGSIQALVSSTAGVPLDGTVPSMERVVGLDLGDTLSVAWPDLSPATLGIDPVLLGLVEPSDHQFALGDFFDALDRVALARLELENDRFVLAVHERRLAGELVACGLQPSETEASQPLWDARTSREGAREQALVNRLEIVGVVFDLLDLIREAQFVVQDLRSIVLDAADPDLTDVERLELETVALDLVDSMEALSESTVLDGRHYANGSHPSVVAQVFDDGSADGRVSIQNGDLRPDVLGIGPTTVNFSSIVAAQELLATMDTASDTLDGYESSMVAVQERFLAILSL